MWNRADIDFAQSQDMPWSIAPDGEFGAGELQRVLSAERGRGASTVVMQLRNAHDGVLTSGADVYVLEGRCTINGTPARAHTYAYVPPGARFTVDPGPVRTTLYLGYFGVPEYPPVPAEAEVVEVRCVDVEARSWTAPEWSGDGDLEPGAFVKWLRRDERGDVYVVAMLPGWASREEESHPTYEESFRLHGDLLQGRRGRMTAGGYSFRSPGIWHCPMGTQGGTMSLIRSNAPSTTDYRASEVGSWDELYDAVYRAVPSSAVW